MSSELGNEFNKLVSLGLDQNMDNSPPANKADMAGRFVSSLSADGFQDIDLREGEHEESLINDVAERITSCVTEVNRIYFLGKKEPDQRVITKHEARKIMRENKHELRRLKQLLKARNETELVELANHIQSTFPDENLKDSEALEIAKKIQGIKLKLPPSRFEKVINGILVSPRLLYAVTTELISGLGAGLLGLLWKANFDPSNPITDSKSPPVLRVHGLMDTQGSSLPMWMMMRARRKLRNLMGKENLKYGSGYSLSYAGLFYNNPKQSLDDYVDKVADKLIKIRQQTGHDKVILQGHSMGGLIINRLAQLQDELKQMKKRGKGVIDPTDAVSLRERMHVEPKIYADFNDLANMSDLSDRKKGRIKQKLVEKLEKKGIEIHNIEDRIDAILFNNYDISRKPLAKSLAEDVANEWFLQLLHKIDPEQQGMEAKWLISLCTPYDGSKIASGITRVQEFLGIRSPRVHELLRKRSEEASMIGSDARNKVALRQRNVYNIACRTNDEFVSEGSATVNYDYTHTKVYKSLAHVGVLFSPRVAGTVGSWLDEIYSEMQNEEQDKDLDKAA